MDVKHKTPPRGSEKNANNLIKQYSFFLDEMKPYNKSNAKNWMGYCKRIFIPS